jgi:hypothetical protein
LPFNANSRNSFANDMASSRACRRGAGLASRAT